MTNRIEFGTVKILKRRLRVKKWDKINRRVNSRRRQDKNPITSDTNVTVKESIYKIERWLNSLASDAYYLHDDFKQICKMSARQEQRIESKLQNKIDRILDCLMIKDVEGGS